MTGVEVNCACAPFTHDESFHQILGQDVLSITRSTCQNSMGCIERLSTQVASPVEFTVILGSARNSRPEQTDTTINDVYKIYLSLLSTQLASVVVVTVILGVHPMEIKPFHNKKIIKKITPLKA